MMMNYLKTLFNLNTWAIILLAIPAVTSASECDGNWTINVDTLGVEYREDKSGYIPAYINLSRDIRNCRYPYISLSIDGKKLGQMQSTRAKLDVEFLDRNFRHLNYVVNEGYRLKLENSAQTKFWIKLRDARLAPSSNYAANVDATLKLSGTPDEKTTRLNHFIPPFVFFVLDPIRSQNIRGLGDHYAMDLGTLNKGDEHKAFFYLLSNANVDVTVEREYGELKHNKKRNIAIDYQLWFDGKPVNNKLNYSIHNQRMLMLDHIPMRLVVGETDFAYAGTYRDVIRVEVKARY
ncbi:hypothetical protein [Vibrio agarivorans]|uniref:DUF3108 domain-containing protein n=1 Tax=Vibrio agarivorans TaxID=153622 RepID=A0ABT7XZR7_9VIBR|nr:hypothetical protein [Vibrio agarivorans]MDN2481284.1 hypothetical protein [Vibrio agarivorans]